MRCKTLGCGSYAINHGSHGRDGSDGDLCDVCYWRKRAGAWFTAADMATAAAQGFREGQAAELAAMRAGGEPYAFAVHFPNDYRIELVHDLDDLVEDMTNNEHIVTALYTHPQPAAQDAERYRLLNLGVDVIQADDEFLSDDTTTWGTDPNGVFVGMPYQGYALLPARRKVDAAIAAQQGDSHE